MVYLLNNNNMIYYVTEYICLFWTYILLSLYHKMWEIGKCYNIIQRTIEVRM